MSPRVFLTGGGTAGHVNPALATAEALVRLRPDVGVSFVGTPDRLEGRLVPEAGWPFHAVPSAPLGRPLSLANLAVPFVVGRAALQVRSLLRRSGAVAACVFGGYTSGPLAAGARLAGVPLVLHEQNAVPGRANRLAAHLATAVGVAVEAAAPRFAAAERVEWTGNPVRGALSTADLPALRAEAQRTFGLDPSRRTLLVFGGSLGARRLNDAVLDAVDCWAAPERLQVLHAAGAGDHPRVAAAWAAADRRGLHTVCLPYLDRMDLAYAAADVVVCRAGASTVAELALAGRPAVLVPYPHAAADEQTANARALVDAGAGVMVADLALDGRELVATVEALLHDEAALDRMGQAAALTAVPDAATRVARLILAAAGDRLPPAPDDLHEGPPR